MTFVATKQHVANRGVPPDSFLEQLIAWAKIAPRIVFATIPTNLAPDDVYDLIKPVLGPWISYEHRQAALVETMRVLSGFESSWNWNEGHDTSNPAENSPETDSAGAFQISWNSRNFGQDLKDLATAKNVHDGVKFQSVTKSDHFFAMEYGAQLFRHTTQHNGPLKHGKVLPWLRADSMWEFADLIKNSQLL